MSGKFNLHGPVLTLVLAFAFGLTAGGQAVISPKTFAPRTTETERGIHAASPALFQATSKRHECRAPTSVHGNGREPSVQTPGWSIPYGKEFWRQAIKPAEPNPKGPQGSSSATIPANIDLGDIIDRVSHAITRDDCSGAARVQAKTYTAAFDGAGVRFSPHRPGHRELLSGQESAGVPPVLDCGSHLPLFTVRTPVQQRQRTAAVQDAIAPVENRGQVPLPDPDTEVTLRRRSVRLGDQVLYERGDRSLSWSLVGNTAQALLDERVGLVEHYEAGGEGVQVSWVLTRSPLKSITQIASCAPSPGLRAPSPPLRERDGVRGSDSLGDLEIELEMDGLSYAGTSDQGIHLGDATGTARVRIGKAFAVDSDGRRSEVAMVANEGRFYVRVSPTILAQATYPLAIDPLISPEFGMDKPVIVPRGGEHQIPAVAWNGTNWLVVWTEWPVFESPVDVVGARVSRDGVVLDPFGILISRAEQPPAAPSVASNGKDFFIVWEHFDFVTGLDIYGARVTVDGQVADPDGIVINNLPNDQFHPSAAGDGEGYLVVWQERRSSNALDIYGTRLSNNGAVMDGDGFPISTAPEEQFQPSVARGPNGFLVVWSDRRQFSSNGYDIYGARLDTNRAVLDPDGIAISTAPKDQSFPRVAANSTGYLVAWLDTRSTGNVEESDIYATLVSSAGVVSHPQGIAVSTATGNQSWPAVAAGSDDFLVVWNDSRPVQPGIYASRVGADGMVLDPEGVLVDPVPKTFFPAVGASDKGFFAVWMRSSRPEGGFGSGILGARLNSRAELIDSQPILITAKGNDEASSAIDSNGADWLVVWQDWRNSDGVNIYGVRISYDGTVLDTSAILISTQPGFAMEPAVASAGSDYLVVWTDGRSSPYDIYGARVQGDGTVMDSGGIPISTAPDFQFNPAVSSDGTNYLVVWQDLREVKASEIYAARVNREGIVLEPNGFPISAGTNAQGWPAAAFNGKDFLVVWTQARESVERQGDICGARVSTDGLVLDPATISISRAPNAQNLPAVASAGSDFLVIWADTRNTVTTNGNTFGGEIYGARVNADGGVLDPDGFQISNLAFRAHPALAFNGIDFLAVWDGSPGPSTNSQIRAAWIDQSGRVLLRDLVVNTNASYPTMAASSSNSFLVVSEGLRNGASRVVGNLVSQVNMPVLQSPTLAGGGATIAWLAEAGKTYRVQFKSDLRKTNWNDLDPILTATNSVATTLDSTIGQDAQRFYRVLQLP